MTWHGVTERPRPSAELDRAVLAQVLDLRDWLLREAAKAPDLLLMVTGLGERLNAIGVQVDRIVASAGLLHSQFDAVGRFWEKGRGVRTSYYEHASSAADEAVYLRSPMYAASQTRQWIVLDLVNTPDNAYGIVPELKAQGYTGYVCAPLFFSNGSENSIAYATRAEGGFSSRDLAVIERVEPTVAAVMEIRTAWRQLNEVLRIYVGDEPRREIVNGAIRRGQVSRIRAVLLVADMRDYTNLTTDRTCEAVVGALNTFFDCLVKPIEERGGEVLKYMGDGLLAIFREGERSAAVIAGLALAAAREALVAVEEADRTGKAGIPLAAGIALHYGEVAYGNVGSGVRLDFTVIGPDVNLASRIAGLNRRLSEPLLMSPALAGLVAEDVRMVDAVTLKGFAGPQQVFAPVRTHGLAQATAGAIDQP